MTRIDRTLPIAVRVAAVALATAASLTLALVPGAANPRDRLEEARKERAQIQDRVETARMRYDQISVELAEKTGEVEQARAQLEAVTANLQLMRERLDAATEELARVQGDLNERAAQTFMQGPGSSFEFMLGSASLVELSDRIVFVGAVAQSDDALIQEMTDAQRRLTATTEALGGLRSEARAQQVEADATREQVLALFQEQQDLLAQIRADLRRAQAGVGEADKAYERWLKAQRAKDYGGGHSSVPMPAGWADTLERCPVDGPRTYGDGFGAPRYSGGYHLHKGVDILAPSGTPIVAPFDGTAYADSNTLGGNVVFVQGRYGRVYNAHLSAYSAKSDGPVEAGDVVGYVGDTGNATGIPHNHFEFHPNVMPSGWPSSAYGYSIIEDALNPYPLLVAACG